MKTLQFYHKVNKMRLLGSVDLGTFFHGETHGDLSTVAILKIAHTY